MARSYGALPCSLLLFGPLLREREAATRFTLIGRPPFSFHLSEGLMVVGNNKHQLELVLIPVLPLKLVQFGLVLRLVIFADPAVCIALGTGEEILFVFHGTLEDR